MIRITCRTFGLDANETGPKQEIKLPSQIGTVPGCRKVGQSGRAPRGQDADQGVAHTRSITLGKTVLAQGFSPNDYSKATPYDQGSCMG